jgi:hypothetical protein
MDELQIIPTSTDIDTVSTYTFGFNYKNCSLKRTRAQVNILGFFILWYGETLSRIDQYFTRHRF